MRYLSRPITELRSHYDAVVVGSGYGGAIAAARLAEAVPGISVCILERGEELQPGEYPETLGQALPQMQIDGRRRHFGRKTALFDFRLNEDLNVLVGCGLGGTSLINAGVLLRPDPEVFSAWPEPFRTDPGLLDRYYDLAEKVLAAHPLPELPEDSARGGADSASQATIETMDAVEPGFDPRELNASFPRLAKRAALDEIAEAARSAPGGGGASARASSPALAVTFTPTNRHGVLRNACTLCGNCVAGCNEGAKGSLISNYLPIAKRAGAEIFCGVAVRRVSRGPRGEDGDRGWLLHYQLSNARRGTRRRELLLHADHVVLAAGTLGSTEILLRSQQSDPRLRFSDQLGRRFQGNGDVLALSYNGERPIHGVGRRTRVPPPDRHVGPTITGSYAARFDVDEAEDANGTVESAVYHGVVQEGSLPRPLANLLRLVLPLVARYSGLRPDCSSRQQIAGWGRELVSLIWGSTRGALDRTLIYLTMARPPVEQLLAEQEYGELKLADGRLRTHWPGAGDRPLLSAVDRHLQRASQRMAARHVRNPTWTKHQRRLITVHPLGGCPMGDDVRSGVVDVNGRVFDRESGGPLRGLYVLDGSIVPTALGVNPLWSICALAERAAASHLCPAVRAFKARRDATRYEDGQGVAIRRANGAPSTPCATAPSTLLIPSPDKPGLTFDERMQGFWTVPADRVGPLERRVYRVALHVTVHSHDLDTLLAREGHRAGLLGSLRIGGLGALAGYEQLGLEERTFTLSDGSFQLFAADRERVETRRMTYRGWLVDADGNRLRLEGEKSIHDSPDRWMDIWRTTTTMHFSLYGAPETAQSLTRVGTAQLERNRLLSGEMHLTAGDLLRACASIRILNARHPLHYATQWMRVGRYYARMLFRLFSYPFGPRDVIDPYRPPSKRTLLLRTMTSSEAGPHLERHELRTRDGKAILLTRMSPVGEEPHGQPVILAPGFGMSTFAFRIPTVETSFSRYLLDAGFDVWLLDYRASDRTDASLTQFTLDDVAEYDWPAAVDLVQRVSATQRIALFGHCVGSGTLLMSLLRGWIPPSSVRVALCSQMHVIVDHPLANRVKAELHLGGLLQAAGTRLLNPDITTESPWSDWLFDFLLSFYPSRERCRNPVCRRNLFLYGDVIRHDKINAATHDLIYDLFDRANVRTLRHLTRTIRHSALVPNRARNGEDSEFYLSPRNVAAIDFPVVLLQGTENNIFRAQGAQRSLDWLREAALQGYLEALRTQPANGDLEPFTDALLLERATDLFHKVDFPGYGHLDCWIGRDAHRDVFPQTAALLGRSAQAGAARFAPLHRAAQHVGRA